MISEEELQSAGAGLSWVSVEMLRIMHYHPQQKTFQIYKFIFSFNSVISSFKASLHLVQFICFLFDIL